MQLNRLKHIPIHVILMPVFYVLHVVNAYFGLYPLEYPIRYLLLYLLLSGLVFALAWFLLRSVTKAGIWSILLLFLVFFFGKLHDFLKDQPLLQPIAQYKILLPIIAILLIWLTAYLIKAKRAFQKTNFFFNILLGCFVLLELGHTAIQFVSGVPAKDDYGFANQPDRIQLKPLIKSQRPDIIFIVFDEYASSASLKKYLNYDNSGLDSFLNAQGFYVAPHSKSNYNLTPFSLASTFNLDYFDSHLENVSPIPKRMMMAHRSFTRSKVPAILRQAGYTVRNIGLLDIESANAPRPHHLFFQREYKEVFYEETIWNRVNRDIGWHVAIKFPATLEANFKKEQKKFVASYVEDFENIMAELKTQSDTPKFVYGHIFMPHRPYYLNRHGAFMNTVLDHESHSRDSLYLEQLAFCNGWIRNLALAANQPHARPRIIIIEGDHGFRDADNEQLNRDQQFMNLSAYYFSDKDYTQLYDSISPVNSFRMVFNKYFDAGLPLLKDSTILLY